MPRGAKTWQQTRYGRLSGEQIEQLLGMFREAWSDRTSLFHPAEDDYKAVLEKLAAIPNWAGFYQCSFNELLAAIAIVAGFDRLILDAAASTDPAAVLLGAVDSISDAPPAHAAAMPLAFAMIGNLEAIARYSRSVNDMLRACRENDDFNALLQALSVDSYIISLPGLQAMIRLAQMEGDPSVADLLLGAIRGPHKRRLVYPELRWAEYLLRDQGAFDACTQDQIHELIVDHLRLYDGDNSLKDSKKALFALFRKWRLEAGIQK